MSLLPAPFLLPVDWWALGAVLGLSVGAMLLLLLEFLPARSGSSRAAVVALVALANTMLAHVPPVWGAPITLQRVFGDDCEILTVVDPRKVTMSDAVAMMTGAMAPPADALAA